MGAIADTLLEGLGNPPPREARWLELLIPSAPSHAAPSIPAPSAEITAAIRLLEANGYAVVKL
jgi:hypothetical protein